MSETPTLLRVKRRITEDPADVLLLSAKRLKSSAEGDTGGDVKILKLAGTVKQDTQLDQALTKIINKKNVPNFSELKERYKRLGKDVRAEERTKEKDRSRDQERFRVVNTKRAIKIDDLEEWSESNSDKSPESEPASLYHLYDVVKEKAEEKCEAKEEERLSCNGIEMIREYRKADDANYVYDVYYAEGNMLCDFDDSLLDGLVSLQPFNTGTEFVYDEYRDDPSEFRYEDDKDSNDEDNSGNEYPDEDEEDDGDYEDEFERGYGAADYSEDLAFRFGRVRMCEGEEDLSSDEEGESLAYTKTVEEDENLHGKSYARYKQQMLREFRDDDLLDDTEEEGESDNDNFDYF